MSTETRYIYLARFDGGSWIPVDAAAERRECRFGLAFNFWRNDLGSFYDELGRAVEGLYYGVSKAANMQEHLVFRSEPDRLCAQILIDAYRAAGTLR